jgi:hypothetical protein
MKGEDFLEKLVTISFLRKSQMYNYYVMLPAEGFSESETAAYVPSNTLPHNAHLCGTILHECLSFVTLLYCIKVATEKYLTFICFICYS